MTNTPEAQKAHDLAENEAFRELKRQEARSAAARGGSEAAGRARAAQDAERAAREHFEALERMYTGWPRYFLVPQGRIHSTTRCPTCNRQRRPTGFEWLTTMSGEGPGAVVGEYGPILCSRCFPDAPPSMTSGRGGDGDDERYSARCGNWARVKDDGTLARHRPPRG